MKAAAASALLLASAEGAIQNSVPIQSRYPGWRLGTKGAPVKVNLFYDFFCPDSKATHYAWKALFPMDSPVFNKTYEQAIDMQITPFVLPYHNHSFPNTQIYIYLEDLCRANKDKCPLIEKFAEFCWANWEEEQDIKKSDDTWKAYWVDKVVAHLNDSEITKETLMSLYSHNDTHNSNWRVREDWKYATSRGASGTPVAFVNGVKLDSTPTKKEDWDALFKEMFAPKNVTMAVEEIVNEVLEPIIESIEEQDMDTMFLY